MKKGSILTILIIFAWLLPVSFANAQSEDLQKAESELDQSIAELNKEKPEGTEPSEEEKLEIAKKVEAFKKVLAFTKAEIADLNLKVEAASVGFGDDLWDFNREIKKHLNDAEQKRNQFELDLVDRDSTLEGIKSLAMEFKNWREGGYDAKNAEIFDFLILSKSETIIDTADDRASKIGKDLRRLKDDLSDVGRLRLDVLLAQAQVELAKAKAFQGEAIELYGQRFDPIFHPPVIEEEVVEDVATIEDGEEVDEASNQAVTESEEGDSSEEGGESDSAIESDEAEVEEVEQIEESAEIDEREISSIIEASLERVQKAYRIFIDMSELAKQLLREE